MAEKYFPINTYAYCAGDPVNIVDPEGKSTYVEDLGAGRYKVVSGDINDNDLGIYVVTINADGSYEKGEMIGESLNLYSFYNWDKNKGKGAWEYGAIIDLYDTSGEDFINRMMNDTPDILSYMVNARNNRKYDFKSTNGTTYLKNLKPYRGMIIKGGVIASARDIGNYIAGYVTGLNGYSWETTRFAFDLYESYKNRTIKSESRSSTISQRQGWEVGYNKYIMILKLSFYFVLYSSIYNPYLR